MFEKVLEIFREICSIPHGSGNTEFISDYCTNFAVSHFLRYYRDKSGNVVIFKNGTEGYETSPAVILQGHLDMVCVKTDETEINFLKDGLKLHETEDFIEAVGTSLGGDDGIAVAYCLAILDSNDVPHPPLEVVFTTDEETGMYGADALDTSVLSGKMMINIDSEEEGTLLVSCAGGVRADAEFEVRYEDNQKDALEINLFGLTGGHSGTEIDKGRLNAVITLARLLENEDINLVSINGGSADNAIPVSCSAVVVSDNIDELENKLQKSFRQIKKKAVYTDENMALSLRKTQAPKTMTKISSKIILSCISGIQNGVISVSLKMNGMVQTSLNLGIIKTNENKVEISHALRSSVMSEKQELSSLLEAHYKAFGAKINFHSDYPAWEFKENSRLQKITTYTFKESYGKEMNVTAIHAGLECGLFCGKIAGLDCVSMGPDIFDIHSTDEKLSKKSAERMFDFLCKILSKLR